MGAINTLYSQAANGANDSSAARSAATRQPVSQGRGFAGPYVALLLFLFINCARPEDWVPGLSDAPLAKIAGILAVVALLFSAQAIRQRLAREILYLALLIGQLFLAAVLSRVWQGGAIARTLVFAKVLIVIVVMAVVVNTARRLRLLILTHAASIAAIAAFTVWKGHLLAGRLDGLLGGNYSDPNELALAFVFSLPLCLALLFLARSWVWKALWAAAILVMTFGVFLTGSRGGFLSLTAMSAVCLWQFGIRGRRPYLIVLTAVLGVAVALSSSGILMGRLKGTFSVKDDTAAAYVSAQSRLELLRRSIEVTREHPFFGVGAGNFQLVSGSWLVAHNSFSQMSSEGGIPALVLYLLILGSGFKNLRAAKRLANRQRTVNLLGKALQASLVGYVVGSFFLSVNYAFFPYYLVAYTTSLFAIAKNSAVLAQKHEAARQAIPAEESSRQGEGLGLTWFPS